MKYKVLFSGFAYVEADSIDEAIELAQDGSAIYEETEFTNAEEVDDFSLRI